MFHKQLANKNLLRDRKRSADKNWSQLLALENTCSTTISFELIIPGLFSPHTLPTPPQTYTNLESTQQAQTLSKAKRLKGL